MILKQCWVRGNGESSLFSRNPASLLSKSEMLPSRLTCGARAFPSLDELAEIIAAPQRLKILTPPHHGRVLDSQFRGLATAGADMVPGVLLSDPMALPKRLVASGFKVGAREKVGMRETQVLHYVVNGKNPGPGAAVTITVWIDTQTNLPLKRVCAMDNGIRTEEVYSDWQLNATMDPALFELPK